VSRPVARDVTRRRTRPHARGRGEGRLRAQRLPLAGTPPRRIPRLFCLSRRAHAAGRRSDEGEKEMIVVATSALNDCLYCVVAHGAILRVYEKKPLIADQVAVNYREADLTPRQRAMLDFAVKVATRSAEIDDRDFEVLRTHGFSEQDIWDIGAI